MAYRPRCNARGLAQDGVRPAARFSPGQARGRRRKVVSLCQRSAQFRFGRKRKSQPAQNSKQGPQARFADDVSQGSPFSCSVHNTPPGTDPRLSPVPHTGKRAPLTCDKAGTRELRPPACAESVLGGQAVYGRNQERSPQSTLSSAPRSCLSSSRKRRWPRLGPKKACKRAHEPGRSGNPRPNTGALLRHLQTTAAGMSTLSALKLDCATGPNTSVGAREVQDTLSRPLRTGLPRSTLRPKCTRSGRTLSADSPIWQALLDAQTGRISPAH